MILGIYNKLIDDSTFNCKVDRVFDNITDLIKFCREEDTVVLHSKYSLYSYDVKICLGLTEKVNRIICQEDESIDTKDAAGVFTYNNIIAINEFIYKDFETIKKIVNSYSK